MKQIKIAAIAAVWLTALAYTQQAAAQQLTTKHTTGKWKVTGVLTKGELMPLDSDTSLINYMLNESLAGKRKKEGPAAILTRADSANTLRTAKVALPMCNSAAEFKSNGKFLFTIVLAFSQASEIKGFWQLDEAAQTILVSEKENDKNEEFIIIKITKRGNQLILQLPDHEEQDGYLLRKKE